jgi:hypothetical protein
MIFGDAAAAIAGFLTVGDQGLHVIALVVLWLAARLLILADAVPPLSTPIDLAFLLLLLRRPPIWSGPAAAALLAAVRPPSTSSSISTHPAQSMEPTPNPGAGGRIALASPKPHLPRPIPLRPWLSSILTPRDCSRDQSKRYSPCSTTRSPR